MSLLHRGQSDTPEPSRDRTPILILGLAGLSMHHGALGVARSAGRLGIPVSYVHTGSKSLIECSRYSRGGIVLSQANDEDRTLEVLRQLAEEFPRAILLAVDDVSAMFVDDHSDWLRDRFQLPDQPKGLARALADKRSMHKLCLEHAVATPVVAFPTCESDVREHVTRAVFPVVVKRIDASHPVAPGTPNVLVAHDPDKLLAAYRAMTPARRPNVMLQEYIPDAPDANWMFNGYFDSSAECRASFTGRKLRQSPPDAGATTLGVCEANSMLEEITTSFMAAIGYRGIVDIDYRFDHRDGLYKMLDVNPRVGSSFRLFVSSEGTDVLRALYLDLTGQRAPTVTQQAGRRWVVEPQDLRSSVICLKRNDLTMSEWLRSLRNVREAAWWARDDPWPSLAMVSLLLVGRLRKMLGIRKSFSRRVSGSSSEQ